MPSCHHFWSEQETQHLHWTDRFSGALQQLSPLITSGQCLHTTCEGSFGSSSRNWEKASIHLGPSKGWIQASKVSTWCPNNSLNIIISSKGKKLREQGLEEMFDSYSDETACSSGRALPWTGTQQTNLLPLSATAKLGLLQQVIWLLSALVFSHFFCSFSSIWGRVSHYFLVCHITQGPQLELEIWRCFFCICYTANSNIFTALSKCSKAAEEEIST